MSSTTSSVQRGGVRQYKPSARRSQVPSTLRGDAIGKSFSGFQAARNETAVPPQQIDALRTLYTSQPAMQACRSVLLGELLSNGFELIRNAKRVEMTPEFTSHLQQHWVPFARDVIDSFLIAGFAVTAQDKDDIVVSGKRRKNGITIPVCAPLDTYNLTFNYEMSRYRRKYAVYPTMELGATDQDEDVDVHIRSPPDGHGNVVSPVATCYELGSMQLAIVELALKAETLRAKQMVLTQPAERKTTDDPLGAASMFFDSESRAIQANLERSSNGEATSSLQMQIKMCSIINSLQTRGEDREQMLHKIKHDGKRTESFVPPTARPELMTLPKVRTALQKVILFCCTDACHDVTGAHIVVGFAGAS